MFPTQENVLTIIAISYDGKFNLLFSLSGRGFLLKSHGMSYLRSPFTVHL